MLLALWWIVYPLAQRLPISLNVVHGLLVVALALCAAGTVRKRASVAVGIPAAAAFVAAISLLIATLGARGDFPVGERWDGAVVGFSHVLFFLCALVLVPQRAKLGDAAADKEDPTAVRMRGGLAAVLGLAALAQLIVVMLGGGEFERLAGTLGNPNLFGAFVAAVGLAVGAFARSRPLSVALFAVFAMVILQTGSRGAFLAGAVVLLGFAARRGVRVGFGVALALAAVLWIVPNPLVERVDALQDHLAYSRPFLWGVGLDNALEHPLGIGASMNKYVFPTDALDPARPWLVAQRHQVGLTHNVFLTLALEWGWLAALAGLALLLWTMWQALRPGPGRLGEDRLGQGAGLGAAVLLVESQVDGLEQNPLLFSLFLLLTAVVLRRLGRPTPELRVHGRVIASSFLVGAVALGAAVLQIDERRDDEAAATAVLRDWRARAVPSEGARENIATFVAQHPDSSRLARTQLDFEVAVLRRELNARATPAQHDGGQRVWDALALARDANPLDPRPLRAAADAALALHRRGGRDPAHLDRYVRYVEELLRLDPYDVDSRRELALEAHATQRAELAHTQLDVLLTLQPYDAFSWWISGLRAQHEGRDEAALAAFIKTRQLIWEARVPAGALNPGARDAVNKLLSRTTMENLEAQRLKLAQRLREERPAKLESQGEQS
ncbi:MAG: hypothetical protein DHS20C15_30750 [Planctomycetota bacterium]|nr:MAG: hypothetical protein DHS20C15_30750 [Planctomycetota bacterium]